MSLVQRRIDVTITLGTGEFGETLGDTITLTNHRVVANMAAVGGDAQGQLELRLYGLPLETINRLTTIGPVKTEIRGKNSISVSAGNDGEALTKLFEGSIDQAWADFAAAPEVALNITAYSALVAAVKPVAASSYKGAADVGGIMADLAKLAGFTFENNGVSVKLNNPYFPGTALDQIKACAKAADISYTIDRGVLAIWPKDNARGGDVPLLSPERGLVGYPTFSSNGLGIQSMFLPGAKMGGQIDIESSMNVAAGRWNIFSVVHNLESQKPNGAWFTFINCYRTPT